MDGKTTSLPQSADSGYAVRLHVMQHTVLRRPFRACFVCLSNACIVTKLVPTFLYHMKDRLS